jgi:hypothetical protein
MQVKLKSLKRRIKHFHDYNATDQSSVPVWTSLTKIGMRNYTMWSSSGADVIYTNWGAGQPEKFNIENCVATKYTNV